MPRRHLALLEIEPFQQRGEQLQVGVSPETIRDCVEVPEHLIARRDLRLVRLVQTELHLPGLIDVPGLFRDVPRSPDELQLPIG